jgi:SAM-dependent methyltransferase
MTNKDRETTSTPAERSTSATVGLQNLARKEQEKRVQRPTEELRRTVERWLLKRCIGNLQHIIESGAISPTDALSIIAEDAGMFSEEKYAQGYKKFKNNSGLIYAGETFFETSYRHDGSGDVYNFRRPSSAGVNFLYKLHQHLSGKEFDSPEKLKAAVQEVLIGKRVLEVGCGPGFDLKLLKDLGADVSGVEIRGDFAGMIKGLDVRAGDAAKLDGVFGDETFDIIYSRNLFSEAVLGMKRSEEIAVKLCEHTKQGGIQIHQVGYKKMGLEVLLFSMWVSNREAGRDQKETEEWFWNKPGWERDALLYQNRCSLDPQDLLREGLALKEYAIENGELNIVATKAPC